MTSIRTWLAVGGAFAAGWTQIAVAEDEGSSFTGSIAVTSDYLFRGISQTNNDPAVQAGVTWASGTGFYAGAWASNVDFVPGDKADVEVDLTTGFAGALEGGLTYDIGLIYYAYPGARSGTHYDYIEGAVKLGYDFGGAAWNFGAFVTPENFGHTDSAGYFTTGLKFPLGSGFALDANVGRAEISSKFGKSYFDYNVGLTYSFEIADINVRFYDTDNKTCAKLCDSRVVFTLSHAF